MITSLKENTVRVTSIILIDKDVKNNSDDIVLNEEVLEKIRNTYGDVDFVELQEASKQDPSMFSHMRRFIILHI